MEKILYVQMFGIFTMEYDGKELVIDRKSTTKTNRLLQLVLHAGKKGILREKLIKAVFENEEVADISNSFRGVLFRLRKMLREKGLPESEYIIYRNGFYYWTPDIPVCCDCICFREKAEHALRQSGLEEQKELEEAAALYRGELLPALATLEWVIFWALEYKKLYRSCVLRLCEIYHSRQEYQKLYDLSGKAAAIYPLDDWQVYQMQALIAMKRSKEAVELYHKTESMLLSEIESEPSRSMLEQLERIGSCVVEESDQILTVQKKLEEAEDTGAFYCSYPVFIENYRFAKRVLQRTGKSAWLLLCTITNGKGYELERGIHLEKIREDLKYAIKSALRSGDLYTRYSVNQYLILLIGIDESNCGPVIERINNRMEQSSGKNYIKYHKAKVTDEKSPEA